MGKPSCARNNWIHAFSWTARYALLVVLTGTLLGCGKGDGSGAGGQGGQTGHFPMLPACRTDSDCAIGSCEDCGSGRCLISVDSPDKVEGRCWDLKQCMVDSDCSSVSDAFGVDSWCWVQGNFGMCEPSTSKSSTSATGTFCNNLFLTGQIAFVGYLNFSGEGVDTTWHANSGECTPCESMPAGESLRFEFGDEEDWIYRFTKTLDIGGEYNFKAEIDDVDGLPGITVYVPNTGYSCEDINYL
jgi:hypothetical protein